MANSSVIRMGNGNVAGSTSGQNNAVQTIRPRQPAARSNAPVVQGGQSNSRPDSAKQVARAVPVNQDGRVLDPKARRGTYLNIVI